MYLSINFNNYFIAQSCFILLPTSLHAHMCMPMCTNFSANPRHQLTLSINIQDETTPISASDTEFRCEMQSLFLLQYVTLSLVVTTGAKGVNATGIQWEGARMLPHILQCIGQSHKELFGTNYHKCPC